MRVAMGEGESQGDRDGLVVAYFGVVVETHACEADAEPGQKTPYRDHIGELLPSSLDQRSRPRALGHK